MFVHRKPTYLTILLNGDTILVFVSFNYNAFSITMIRLYNRSVYVKKVRLNLRYRTFDQLRSFPPRRIMTNDQNPASDKSTTLFVCTPGKVHKTASRYFCAQWNEVSWWFLPLLTLFSLAFPFAKVKWVKSTTNIWFQGVVKEAIAAGKILKVLFMMITANAAKVSCSLHVLKIDSTIPKREQLVDVNYEFWRSDDPCK